MKYARQLVTVAGALVVSGIVVPPRALASGHLPDSPLMLVAILPEVFPVLVACVVALGTLFGRPGGLKFVFGVASSIFASGFALIFFERGTPGFVVAAVLGVLLIGVHVVRFCIHLLSRATGGRNRETLRKLWRYL
jgi:hypothetical protein